ncbi:MAG: hypothetical protein WC332_02745 [Clostridia bacterium]
MSIISMIITLLSNRRVWAGIVGLIVVICELLGIGFKLDSMTLTDLLTQLGVTIAMAIPAVLALLSYINPKK